MPSWPALPTNIQLPAVGNLHYLEYSPDRKWALVIFLDDWNLYSIDLENGQSIVLQPRAQYGLSTTVACWAHDGKFIYYLFDDFNPLKVYQINTDGKEPKLLYKLNVFAGGAIFPTYACSPSGKEIAFSFWKKIKDSSPEIGLAILDINTGNVRSILSDWLVDVVKPAPEK
jgi:hypothetical protein